jgi:hypothetical protein
VTPGEWIAALGEAAAKARAKAGHADVHVVVAGRPIRVRVAPENLRALLDPLAATNGSPEDARTIELWDVAACGVAPPRLPGEARHVAAGMGGAISWLSSPTTAGTWQDGGPVLLTWDAVAGTVSGWIGDSTRLPAWQRAAPLRAPLNWVLRGPGRTLVHAAAVGRGGRGLLIGGAGGSGKSTTALSWMLSGGDFAGENDVLVDLDGSDGPAAAPVYANAKVDAGTIRLLPELATARPVDDELGGKSVLDIRKLRPGQPTGPIPIGAIVIPRVAGRTLPAVKPIAPAAALRALAPSSVLQLPGERGGLAVMAALVRQLPSFEVELALDPAANVDALERVLPA